MLGALLEAIRVPWEVEPAREPFLHPGPRGDACWLAGEPAGWLGEIHPAVAARWDLEQAAGFELDFGVLARAADVVPGLRGPDLVPVRPPGHGDRRARRRLGGRGRRRSCKQAGGSLLSRAEVFDVYRGAQVGEGSASLALRLEFRARDRTLTDEEADKRREKIVAALAERLGARLRA